MPLEQCSVSIGLMVYLRIAEHTAKKARSAVSAPGFLFIQSKVFGRGGWGSGKGEKAFLQKSFSPFPANNTS